MVSRIKIYTINILKINKKHKYQIKQQKKYLQLFTKKNINNCTQIYNSKKKKKIIQNLFSRVQVVAVRSSGDSILQNPAFVIIPCQINLTLIHCVNSVVF